MKQISSLKKNLVFNTAHQVLLIVSPLIVTPYIARIFEASGIGAYTLTNTIANYFFQFALMGVSVYGSRSIAYVRDSAPKTEQMFSEIYFAQLVYCIVAVTFYLLYVCLFPIGQKQLAYIQFLYVFSCIFDVTWFLNGIERIDIIAKVNFVIRFLVIISIFIFVKNGNDLWVYTFIMSCSFFCGVLITFWFSFLYVKIIKVDLINVVKHFCPIGVLFLPVIAANVYKTMDKVMLGVITHSEAVVGYYSYSELLLGIPQGLVASIGLVMLPRAANMFAVGKDWQAKRELRDTLLVINFLSVALSFGVSAVSKEFVPLFLGSAMAQCADYVVMLAPSNVFILWGYAIRDQYLIPMKKDKSYILTVIFGALMNFGINMLLIPKMGISGAILGTVFSELFVAGCQSVIVRRDLKLIEYIKDAVPFVAFGFFMFVVVREIGNCFGVAMATVLAEIIIGGLVYAGLSLCYMYFLHRQQLMRLAKHLFPKLSPKGNEI